jgi:hypothetical protein
VQSNSDEFITEMLTLHDKVTLLVRELLVIEVRQQHAASSASCLQQYACDTAATSARPAAAAVRTRTLMHPAKGAPPEAQAPLQLHIPNCKACRYPHIEPFAYCLSGVSALPYLLIMCRPGRRSCCRGCGPTWRGMSRGW